MAWNNLGRLYADGSGVEKDDGKAASFWTKAVDGGAFVAGEPLGRAFWDGSGVGQDKKHAIAVWTTSATKGDPRSHERLAWVAELGRDGSAADPALALYHYAVAASLDEQAGVDPSYDRARCGTLARLLPVAVAADAWRKSLDFKRIRNGDTE